MTAHGTRSRYQRGCRCDPCTAANRDYQRAYMQDSARTIPADHIRATICALITAGEKQASIAARTGHTPSLVSRIASGRVRRLHPETAQDFRSALERSIA